MDFSFEEWRSSTIRGQSKPSDYKIVFGNVGMDTSAQYTVEVGFTTPPIPVNFAVFNTSEAKKIDFAFVELDASTGAGKFSAVYDALRPRATRSDYIVFLEKDSRDSTVVTWAFNVLFDSSKTLPGVNDTVTIVLAKIFRSSDVFEFSTKAQRIDAELATSSLDKIRIVPNPYVAAATWEERNPFTTGRGPRSIHFNHLPQKCTIRIFNVSGELVATIEHESSLLDGSAEWNLLTRDNLSVSYGIYIYHIEAPGIGEKLGKFAVIK